MLTFDMTPSLTDTFLGGSWYAYAPPIDDDEPGLKPSCWGSAMDRARAGRSARGRARMRSILVDLGTGPVRVRCAVSD